MDTHVIEGVSDTDLAAETRAINKIKAVPNPPIDGDKFVMCGVDVVIPPLKAKHLVKFAATMQSLAKFTAETPADEAFLAALPILHAAMTRNYPSLSTDDVMELLDVSQLSAVTLSIMGRSGYKVVGPGEK